MNRIKSAYTYNNVLSYGTFPLPKAAGFTVLLGIKHNEAKLFLKPDKDPQSQSSEM